MFMATEDVALPRPSANAQARDQAVQQKHKCNVILYGTKSCGIECS